MSILMTHMLMVRYRYFMGGYLLIIINEFYLNILKNHTIKVIV